MAFRSDRGVPVIALASVILISVFCLTLIRGFGKRGALEGSNSAQALLHKPGGYLLPAVPESSQSDKRSTQPAAPSREPLNKSVARYLKTPMAFEVDDSRKCSAGTRHYVSHSPAGTVAVGPSGASIALKSPSRTPEKCKPEASPSPAAIARSAKPVKPVESSSYCDQQSLEVNFLGSKFVAQSTAAEPLPGKSNYLVGKDSVKWKVGIPTYARVKYKSIYPGIDVEYYGTQDQVEYDFIIAPKADPSLIAIYFGDSARVEHGPDGSLMIYANGESFKQFRPVAYQATEHGRRIIRCEYVIERNKVRFLLEDYDHNLPLIIDPAIPFTT